MEGKKTRAENGHPNPRTSRKFLDRRYLSGAKNVWYVSTATSVRQ